MIAKYGTTVFFMKDPRSGAQLVSFDELKADHHHSLDVISWQPVLQEYGWNLLRPPVIDISYHNNELCIKAETPSAVAKHMKEQTNKAVLVNYHRAIASLVFPHTNISELPVNTNLNDVSQPFEHDPLFHYMLEQQIWAAVERHFGLLLENYNRYLGTHLTPGLFHGLDKQLAIVEMLKTDHSAFLREVIPLFINEDCSSLDDNALFEMRARVLAFENDIEGLDDTVQMAGECSLLLKKASIVESLKRLANNQFNVLLTAFNHANRCDYRADQFPPESRYIAVMEMLNHNGQNIAFLRQMLGAFLDMNLSNQSDASIFAFRDRITQGYMDFIEEDSIEKMASRIAENRNLFLEIELKPNADFAERFLKLAIFIANSGIQAISDAIGLPIIVKDEDRQALSRQLLIHLTNKMMDPRITAFDTQDWLPQTPLLLDFEPNALRDLMHTIANELANQKSLYQRGSLSFFGGGHAATINAFVSELRTLERSHTPPEQLKFRFIDVLQRFYDDLMKSRKTKTLVVLNNALNCGLSTANEGAENAWDDDPRNRGIVA